MFSLFTISVPIAEIRELENLLRESIHSNNQLRENFMANLTEAVAKLGAEVTLQLAQTSEALAAIAAKIEALEASEAAKAELQAQLEAALAANTMAVEAIEAQTAALAADNPVIEEPVIEEPIL